MRHVLRIGVFATLVVSPGSAFASTGPIVLVYDHASVNRDMELRVALHPGDQFQLKVLNTCPSQFNYAVHGREKTATPGAGVASFRASLSEKVLDPVTHDSKYGAYDVEIKKADGGQPCDVPLEEVRLRIAVETIDWRFVQSAALAFTVAPQPHYFAQPQPVPVGQPPQFKVLRNKDNEDPGRFEVATLTHVYPPGRRFGLAAGFGAQQNQLQYYLGASFDPTRGSHLFNIASGLVWASQPRLPDGIAENDLISDATKLNDLPSGHRIRFFFSVTASFFQSSGQGKATAPAK